MAGTLPTRSTLQRVTDLACRRSHVEFFAGVGNPRRQAGLFVAAMLDGSVRVLTPDIDPEVFKSLVTPTGGEPVGLD